MPGSSDPEQKSSSLTSRLRKFRFRKKPKLIRLADTSVDSRRNNSTGLPPNKTSDHPLLEKSSDSDDISPLNRKSENPNDSVSLLRNICRKIVTAFNSTNSSILDLALTMRETKELKDTVLQQPSISVKWNSNVKEFSVKDPNVKLFKIKHMYMCELAKYIVEKMNNKLDKENSGQLRPKNPPVRTYIRIERTENMVKEKKDEYEEFCKKEDCLKKMLDAFPETDILEAQDILEKCQWDLDKAMFEARNQTFRTARKRPLLPGIVPSPPTAVKFPNQSSVVTQQAPNLPKPKLEEIVLDSSDEDEMNSSTYQQSNTTGTTSYSQSSVMPPEKRTRHLISTDRENKVAATARPCLNTLYQKPNSRVLPAQQKTNSSVQPVTIPTPTTTQNDLSSNKTINISQSLSIKPVTVSTTFAIAPASTDPYEKASATTMPCITKGLIITQVCGSDNLSHKIEEERVTVNETHSSKISSNISKSAHLVGIKPSNISVSCTNSNQFSSPNVTSPNAVANTSLNVKAVNIPMVKGLSTSEVNQTFNVPQTTTKKVNATPVRNVTSKNSRLHLSSNTKSPVTSSAEEDCSLDDIPINQRIKNAIAAKGVKKSKSKNRSTEKNPSVNKRKERKKRSRKRIKSRRS